MKRGKGGKKGGKERAERKGGPCGGRKGKGAREAERQKGKGAHEADEKERGPMRRKGKKGKEGP